MRLKKNKKNKTEQLNCRCSEYEKNRIKQKALLYCDGNISEYLIYAALEFVPNKDDFEKGEK